MRRPGQLKFSGMSRLAGSWPKREWGFLSFYFVQHCIEFCEFGSLGGFNVLFCWASASAERVLVVGME